MRGVLASLLVAALAGSAGGYSHQPLAGNAVGPGRSAQTPTLSLTPTSGLPGTRVVATGTGYTECFSTGGDGESTTRPGSEPGPRVPGGYDPAASVVQRDGQVVLFWDEVELSPRAVLDEGGAFTTSFDVPATAAPKAHSVVALCVNSEDPRILASDTFRVTAPPSQTAVVPNLSTEQAPPEPEPGGPPAAGPVPLLPGEPTTAQRSPAPQPSSAQPVPPPVSPSPPAGTSFPGRLLLVVLVLILLGVLGATAIRQIRRAPAWVATHVRAAPGFSPPIDVNVAESRVDDTSRACVVRITPHRDDGTQVLEV